MGWGNGSGGHQSIKASLCPHAYERDRAVQRVPTALLENEQWMMPTFLGRDTGRLGRLRGLRVGSDAVSVPLVLVTVRPPRASAGSRVCRKHS